MSEIHGNSEEKINIKNFDLFTKHRNVISWGGVAILIGNNLKSRPLNLPNMECLEVIRVHIKDNDMNVLSIYLPPNKPLNIIKKDLNDLFNFTDNLRNVIFGGDFNAHHTYWGCQTDNSYGEWLIDKITISNLSLMNNGNATRI